MLSPSNNDAAVLYFLFKNGYLVLQNSIKITPKHVHQLR